MGVFLAPKITDTSFQNGNSSRYESSLEITDEIPNETDWTKVKDITSRRRIQNRISQRNRRRKLKEKQEQQQRAGNSPSPLPGSRQNTPPASKTPPPAQTSPYDEGSPNLMFEKTPYLRHLMARNGSVSSTSTPTMSSQTPQDSQAQLLPGSWTLPPKEANSVVSQILNAQRHGSTSSDISDHYAQRHGSTSSELSDHYALPTPPTRHNLDDSNQMFWDTSLMQAPSFEDNGLNLYFADCDLFTSPPPRESNYPSNENAALDPKLVEDYMTPPRSSKSSPESLQANVDSAHTDIAGYTPLHLAVQKGHFSIVQILLNASSTDLNAIAKDGMSPLHLSVYSGNHSMTSMLLEKGANCDIHNAIGQNMLHLAVERGDLDLVKLVLNYVKDPNKRDCLGQTAFHCAVAQGHEEIVKFMLAKGIN